MAKKQKIKQLTGIIGNLSGTYNGMQFCKNGVIRWEKKVEKKKRKD